MSTMHFYNSQLIFIKFSFPDSPCKSPVLDWKKFRKNPESGKKSGFFWPKTFHNITLSRIRRQVSRGWSWSSQLMYVPTYVDKMNLSKKSRISPTTFCELYPKMEIWHLSSKMKTTLGTLRETSLAIPVSLLHILSVGKCG